ncbi:MAG: DUF1801 domain-containing protein [Bacteroidetes bacterium]|nr:DUF1801 domain-containing protein [Bacteroidota bacterium]
MSISEQIEEYITKQPEVKAYDMKALHQLILGLIPNCKLWFLDGRNIEHKVVSNPNIGYGFQNIKYADGSSKDFYQIGLSANTSGISLYILGIDDKSFLSTTYASSIGKASVTGYCIKFKKLKDINIDVLAEAIKYGVSNTEMMS